MSYFNHGYGTPENKIAQFAQMGLMPSKFKGASYLPYTMWNKSTDNTVEIDASHKDRLSRSAQKNYRRWSRRLNGGNSTGSGWVLKDGEQATNQVLQDEYSAFYQSYQEIRYGRYDSRSSNSPSSDGHTSSSNSPGNGHEYSYSRSVQDYNSSQRLIRTEVTTINNHQRSKSQGPYPHQSNNSNSSSSDSPERWYSRSERRFRLRKEMKTFRNSITGLLPVTVHRSNAPEDSSQLYTRRSRPTRSKSLGRGENYQRSRAAVEELFHRRPLHDAGKLPDTRSPERRREIPTQSSNSSPVLEGRKETPSKIHSNETGNVLNTRSPEKGRDRRTQSPNSSSVHAGRKEPPSKGTSSGVVNLTLDAATFFGTSKEKTRTPSSDGRGAYTRNVFAELPSATNEDEAKVSPQKVEKSNLTPISHPRRASVINRRESSQSKEGSLVKDQAKDSESSKVDDTPKYLGFKSSKKAAEREQQDRTPVSADRPSDTDRRDIIEVKSTTKLKSEETHKMARRSSPNKGDIKPKALIKPGLRSAKKEPKKSCEARGEIRSRTPSKKKATANGSKLVQRTLDSFFSPKPSPSLQKSASFAGIEEKLEEPKSRHSKGSRSTRKSSKEHSRRSERECTRKSSSHSSAGEGHIRRIYQDDEVSRPVVRLTLLKEDQLWKVASNSATDELSSSAVDYASRGRRSSTARLAEVTPIPSPAKKRGCESPTRKGSPPLKVVRRSPIRRDSCDSIVKAKVAAQSTSRRDSCDSTLSTDSKQGEAKANVGGRSPTRRQSSESKDTKVKVPERSLSRRDSKDSRSSKNPKSKRGSGDSKDLKVRFSWDAPSRRESCDSRSSNDPNENDSRVTVRSPLRRNSCDSSKDLKSRRESCDASLDSEISSLRSGKSPLALDSPAKVVRPSPVKRSGVSLDKSPTKTTPSKKPTCEVLKTVNTNAESCDLPVVLPISPTKKLACVSSEAPVSPSKACPAPAPKPSPSKVARRTPVKVQPEVPQAQTQEDEIAQVQRDEAARKAEADQAAQRNKKRHSRGRKVFAYCDVLGEHIERHPVQNEIPANKWYKWLNPSQLRCLTLIMLDNKDLCLNFSLDDVRNEEWEAAWVKLAKRLNTVCYSDLTKLNTGLRMTVSEWKSLWLEMKTTVRSRVEAMKPEERRHSLGSLDCLLFSQDLYNALLESNGECLGKDCPRLWCSGACIGVMPPTEAPARRGNEE